MRLRVSRFEFLRKSGVSLPSDYAGGFSREFVLKNIGERLPLFLEAAKGAGYSRADPNIGGRGPSTTGR